MADAEIKNVRKGRDGDITDVGVRNSWEWTVAQVVASIESGSNTVYVNCPQRANVLIAKSSTARKFLKTTAGTTTKNNLDSLSPLRAASMRFSRPCGKSAPPRAGGWSPTAQNAE